MTVAAVREDKTSVRVTVSPDNSPEEARGDRGETFLLSPGEWKRLNRSLGYDPAAGMVLSPGTPLDEALYDALAAAAERSGALWTAARMLSASDRSAAGLGRALREKGFSPEAAEHAVLVLGKKGWLDEDAACRRYAEAVLRTKRYGRRRILDALLAKGYGREEARSAVDALPDGEVADALRRQVVRRFPDLASPDSSMDRGEREKALASLLRLGFSPDEIRSVLRRMREDG